MSDIKNLPSLANMSDEELDAALTESEPSPQMDLQSVQNQINDYEKYNDKAGEAFSGSLGSGLTLGISDQALTKLGVYRKDELKKLRDQNPSATLAGEVIGTVAPTLASGGTSAVAKGVAKAGSVTLAAERAGLATERLLASALSQTGNKKLAKEIVRKSIAKGMGSAVEGAAYGAGQLVREDALGEADLNAENLLSYIGGGAIIGGGIGGALGLAAPVAKVAGKKVAGVGNQVAKKYFNPKKDAQKLFGFTDKEIIKNPKLLEDTIEFSKNKMGLHVGDNIEDILRKTESIKQAAIKDLDDVYTAVGDNAIDRGSLRNIAQKIEKEFVTDKEGLKSFSSMIKPAKDLVSDLYQVANQKGALTIKDIRKFRQNVDIQAEKFRKSLDPTLGAEAANRVRNLVRDELNTTVNAINPELGRKLTDANKNFYLSEKISNSLEKKLLKDKDILSFKELVLGGVTGGVFGPGGLVIPAAQKFLESDLKRKVTVLSNIERFNKLSESRIAQGVKSFFSGAGKATKKIALYSLASSPIARLETEEKPKNRKEAFKAASKKIVDFNTDPEKFIDNVNRDLYFVSNAAPQAAEVLADRAIRSMQFLSSKIPKSAKNVVLDNPFSREYEPSTMELAKFERYAQVIDNPMSVIDELENGTMTQEHAEALRTIYPNLYGRIQVAILDEVSKHPNMAYSKKIQLGTLFNIATDESLVPENILALQSNFVPEDSQQGAQQQPGAINPTATGASKLNMASREASGVQKTTERDS